MKSIGTNFLLIRIYSEIFRISQFGWTVPPAPMRSNETILPANGEEILLIRRYLMLRKNGGRNSLLNCSQMSEEATIASPNVNKKNSSESCTNKIRQWYANLVHEMKEMRQQVATHIRIVTLRRNQINSWFAKAAVRSQFELENCFTCTNYTITCGWKYSCERRRHQRNRDWLLLARSVREVILSTFVVYVQRSTRWRVFGVCLRWRLTTSFAFCLF